MGLRAVACWASGFESRRVWKSVSCEYCQVEVSVSEGSLVPLNFHTPPTSHAVPLLSFLKQNSVYNLLPQGQFISRCSVDQLFCDILDKIFFLSLSLHLPFVIITPTFRYHYTYLSLSLLGILNSSTRGEKMNASFIPFHVYQNTRHYCREEDNFLKNF